MSSATYVPEKVMRHAKTVAWAYALGAITAEALVEREGCSPDTAREILEEAVELGLLESHSVLVGYSPLYSSTVAGRSLARKHALTGGYVYPKGMRWRGIQIQEARHMIACASVAGALERRYPDNRVIAERELHREESELERRLATVEYRDHGQTRSHAPDIVIWPPTKPGGSPPPPIAVEVELTIKDRERLTTICRAWARCRHIEATLYYAANIRIEERLLDTIEQCKAQGKVVVNPLGAIITAPPGFELSPWDPEDNGD